MSSTIKRALISVSDKTDLEPLANCLAKHGIDLVSTGGTARYLKSLGHDVTEVSEVTQFPEMLDGRVKTLHPGIHGGLLAARNKPEHMQSLKAHDITAIDLLVVNLYPFESTLLETDNVDALIENIDIGGPAMIRAAAKNHDAVTVVTDPTDYEMLIASIEKTGGTTAETRRALAAKAYAKTASYDASVSGYLSSLHDNVTEQMPAYLLDAKRVCALSYGENPHQQAWLYNRHLNLHGIAGATQLSGKPLSYNNLMDADHAYRLVHQFERPACVIVKHGNPCGVAIDETIQSAFTRARSADPQSAFGGIVACNAPFDDEAAQAMSDLFVEVLIAPDITPAALDFIQAKKPKLRVLKSQPGHSALPYDGLQIKTISGGYLVQTQDRLAFDAESFKCVTEKTPDKQLLDELHFAFEVVRAVSSNAIVLAKNQMTIGTGAGQMSRVDSVQIAIEHAARYGHETKGCVLASDAFFPFADNVELAAKAGISAIIQPGGSMRDEEVIKAANTHGITMVFTGTRHFRH